MNKKVLYGAALVAITILIAGIGGMLSTTYAQSTNDGQPSTQHVEVPFSFKMGNWFKCKPKLFGGLIQVSPEYNETVMSILSSNNDIKRLLDQGYVVTSIRPVVTAYVQGDGTITFKAEKSVVILSNGNTMVVYVIDVPSRSVTHIATVNVGAIKELGRCCTRGLQL